MWNLIRSHPRSLLLALAVHLAVLAVLTLSLEWPSSRPAPMTPAVEVINAVAVDEAQVQAEQKKLRDAERKRQEELKRAQEKAKQAEAERKREEKRIAALKKEREAEQRRLQETERQRQAKERAEKERLAKLEAEKKVLEERRRAEQERLAALEAQRKAEEEARRKAEAERQRQAEEERKRAEAERQRQEEERKRLEAEAALKAQMAAEQARLEAARRAQELSTIEKYRILIEAKVRQNWLVPPTAEQGMVCVLSVRLIPSGDVVSVQIVESSGDAVFDRSVENAVRKASPLPLPPADLGLYDEFRELRFPFELQKKG